MDTLSIFMHLEYYAHMCPFVCATATNCLLPPINGVSTVVLQTRIMTIYDGVSWVKL